MLVVDELDVLSAQGRYWVPAVTAPARDWPGAPGCRRGARFLIEAESFHAGHRHFPAFDSRADCLRWILAHQGMLRAANPGAPIRAVALDRWMLGLDAIG